MCVLCMCESMRSNLLCSLHILLGIHEWLCIHVCCRVIFAFAAPRAALSHWFRSAIIVFSQRRVADVASVAVALWLSLWSHTCLLAVLPEDKVDFFRCFSLNWHITVNYTHCRSYFNAYFMNYANLARSLKVQEKYIHTYTTHVYVCVCVCVLVIVVYTNWTIWREYNDNRSKINNNNCYHKTFASKNRQQQKKKTKKSVLK